MEAFQPLFDITVQHSYFAKGKCSCLDFLPNANTARMMRNTGILIKKTGNGILVLYAKSKLEAVRLYLENGGEGLEFDFKLYAADPDFKTYTEPFSEAGGEVLYFDNQSKSVSTDGMNRLHASKYISSKNLLSLDSVQLKDVLSQKDRLIPPVSVVKIRAKGKSTFFDEQFESTAPSFFLNFKARQTYWKYYLQSEKADKNTYIFDPDNRVNFVPADPARLSDGRTLLSYRSKEPIPLNENYDFRFQLKQPKNGGEQILYKQLPFARVGQTGKEVVAKKARVVSEIYINC